MTGFEKFRDDLLELVKRYEKQNVALRVEEDMDSESIRIFGQRITSLARARTGLGDVIEHAHTTAEHHPYWNVLYNCSEIASSVLEKWHDSLSDRDMSDIRWAISQINQTLDRLESS